MEVKEWFGDMADRYRLVRNFNKAAKSSFINGEAPTLLEVKITRGDSSYKHAFSKWMASGFRIKALSGRALSKSEMIEIGKVVLGNEELVRKLISLGWDTLEVQSDQGVTGLKWDLGKFANIGGFLS